MLLPASVSAETPQRQHRPKLLGVLVFRRLGIIFVVVKLFFVSVLDDHSLHNFERSFHADTEQRVLNLHLLLLLRLFLFFILHLFLDLIALDLFISGHVCIEDLPLSGFQ